MWILTDWRHQTWLSNNHDYRCFHQKLSGFHTKEQIYRIDTDNFTSTIFDLEITITDIFNRGLDAFIMENCGQFDARCLLFKENFGTNYKFTIKDADPHKEYFLIIDGKSVTGEFRVSTFCRKRDFSCDAASPIRCGETKFGNTHDGHRNYSNYSCFHPSQTGFFGKELIYEITNRSTAAREDIEITLEDLDERGLDIFILENCGKEDWTMSQI